MLRYVSSHPGETPAGDLQVYLQEQAKYFCKKESWSGLFSHLEMNCNLFLADLLALFAHILLLKADNLPETPKPLLTLSPPHRVTLSALNPASTP